MPAFHGLTDSSVVYDPTHTYAFEAQRGLIQVTDQRDGNYQVMTVKAIAERYLSFREMLERTGRSNQKLWSKDVGANYPKWRDFIANMAELAKKAHNQGQPFDPAVMRDQARPRAVSVTAPSRKDVF